MNVANTDREDLQQDIDEQNIEQQEAKQQETGPQEPDEAQASGDSEQQEGRAEEEEAPALQKQVDAMSHELSELNDKLLRQAAEYQNYRRRTEREKARMIEEGRRQVILPMLEVLDDLERSLEAAGQVESDESAEAGAAYSSLREGVELVYQKFLTELEKLEVEPIEAVGQPFDEKYHEAVFQQPASEEAEAGTVLEEVQTGYLMGGERVLRHSKVVVAA